MSSEPIPATGIPIITGLNPANAPAAAGSTPGEPTSAQATTDAKRIAGAILEVLAGVAEEESHGIVGGRGRH